MSYPIGVCKEKKMAYKTVVSLVCVIAMSVACFGQTTSTTGSLSVTVLDQTGAAIPGATLEVRDLSTNDIRRGATQANGVYSFPNLPGATYELKVSAQGFASQVFESVVVRTSLETSVRAQLKIGATSESVTVSASETPLVQTESSTISTSLDTKQIFNLPLATQGRDVFSLVYLTPGWATTNLGSNTGTFNNLPGGAIVSADFDGTAGISNRFRSSGYNSYGTTVVQARLENIAEMTITTGQLDLSGNGTSAMRISIVSKRGSNEYHGRLYEDFRNTVLNSNSWSNNANVNAQGKGTPRAITKYNEFGGSVGGPILKNKLFFFGTWGERKNPNTSIPSATVLNPSAQQGIFQYLDTAGRLQSVNVLQVAKAAGLPSTVHPNIAGQLSAINGILGEGTLVQSQSDPNLSTLTWANPSTTTVYYPTIRGDYNVTDNLRFNVSYTQQKTSSPKTYAPVFPKIDTVDRTSYMGNNRIAGFGVDYTFRPTLINQFRAGYMYQYSIWDPENLGLDLASIHGESWGYGTSLYHSGIFPRSAISSLYSQLSANDSLIWQRGNHSVVFGGSWWREYDKYWNGPGGWTVYSFGLNSNDPAYSAINNAMPGVASNLQASARGLYATLVARISQAIIGPNLSSGRPLDPVTKQYKPYGSYNLNEIQQAAGFWVQDRWRLRSNLTLNFGLRWDIVGDDYDKDGSYTSAKSLADQYGPTPVGALFQPGRLGGVAVPSFTAKTHLYNTTWVNPQPAIAIAWNPYVEGGILGKLIGRGKTVIRTGYSIRNYLEGGQNTWGLGSGGMFFFQQGQVNPDPNRTGAGYFKPGSLHYGDPLPAWQLNPQSWAPEISANQMFGSAFNMMNPNIRQPYVQSWNFGIQRELPAGNALEVNYVGNKTLHSWLSLNLNEVNIFENGFLPEFQNAQRNLAINQQNGRGNTAFNNGLPGQVPLPIFTAAFGSSASASGWTGIVTNLQNGAAGAQARSMVSTTSYLCNLIGSANFAPCAPTAGAGYPLNFWNINPYAKTAGINYLDAAGKSNYHALQVQLRQRLTRGAQFTFAYTIAHSLVLGSVNNIQSQGLSPYTLRNLRLNYGPSNYDIRQVFRASGTYDLPFGKGRQFFSQNPVAEAVLGNWTLGTVISIQTGNPSWISGGYQTVTNADSGVNLLGFTADDFQSQIEIRRTGNPYVLTFDPKYIGANGMANPQYLTPATTPGVFGYRPVFRAPVWWNADLSATKTIPIHERWKLSLQGMANNVFNHPTIGIGNLGVMSTSFGRATPGGTRRIELRANIEF
jgi:hypothetical protein